MPAFYETDDLNTWIFTVFTEEYEWGADQENQYKIIDAYGVALLKDYTEDKLKMCMDWDKKILAAVLNSIDYDALGTRLDEWAEESLCEKCHCYTDGNECEEVDCQEEEEESGGE